MVHKVEKTFKKALTKTKNDVIIDEHRFCSRGGIGIRA